MFASASSDKQVLVWHSKLSTAAAATPEHELAVNAAQGAVSSARPRSAPAGRTATAAPPQSGPIPVVQSTDFQPPPTRPVQQHQHQQTKRQPATQARLLAPAPVSVASAPAQTAHLQQPPQPQQERKQQQPPQQEQQQQQPLQQEPRQMPTQMDSVAAMLQQMASQLDILTRTVVSMDERLSAVEERDSISSQAAVDGPTIG
jgi:hypothetical protein